MKLSGSLLATVAALSLGWTAPAVAGEPRATFRPSSAVLAPKVILPSSALFAGSSTRIWQSASNGVTPSAKRYRDRPAGTSVVRIGRSSPLGRAAPAPLNRFISGREGARSSLPSRPATIQAPRAR